MKKETKSKDAPKEHKQPWQEKDGGYIAVHRSGLEMEEYRRKLADEAMTDDSMTAGF